LDSWWTQNELIICTLKGNKDRYENSMFVLLHHLQSCTFKGLKELVAHAFLELSYTLK